MLPALLLSPVLAIPGLAVPPKVQALEQGVQDTLAGLSKLLGVYTHLRADAQERCRGRFPTPEEKKEIESHSTKIAELQKEIAATQELMDKVQARGSEDEQKPKK